jgi:hypothetical protein
MRLLFTVMFAFFAGLFLVVAVLEFIAGNWKPGLGGLVMAAPILYALLAPWPRKPAPPELPRERSLKQAEREPLR